VEINLPSNWKPRDYQEPAWESWLNGCNRQLLVWHRRAGKDDINLRQHAVGAFNRVGTYWHMLPEYSQARKAIWDAVNPHTGKRRIDEAFPEEIRESTRNQDMFIRFKNGSTWQVVGSDSYNSLVGTPPVGLTFSEFALGNPSAWAYLAPILAENNGWVSFISTPRGNNHMKGLWNEVKDDPEWFTQILTVDDTKSISPEEVEKQRAIYRGLFGIDQADILIDQEYFCSWSGGLMGAYFAAEMRKAEQADRMKSVPIDTAHPVHVCMDLGKTANNPVWIFQVIAGQLRIVDFYMPESDDLDDWCIDLRNRGFSGNCYVPHDIMVTEWGSKKTRMDRLIDRKMNPKRIARVSVADGLQAGRMAINNAVFDADNCELGIDGLKNYRREWDDELKTFRENPVKDWAEHIGSAWRYLGLAWKEAKPPKKEKKKPAELVYQVRPDGSVQANMSVREAVDAMVRRKRMQDD
jgi:phage terminase large subunit